VLIDLFKFFAIEDHLYPPFTKVARPNTLHLFH
jgi:hypothetical protein